jgi:hypothetical protein
MPQDVFGIDTTIGGAWQLDGAFLNIEDSEDLIVTSANVSYNRITTKFSPINQRKKYMATGEANGQITLGTIVGPSKGIREFIERYSDPCRLRENILTIQPAGVEPCPGEEFIPVEFKCGGVLLSTINLSVTQLGQNMTVLNAGLGLSFISLQLK